MYENYRMMRERIYRKKYMGLRYIFPKLLGTPHNLSPSPRSRRVHGRVSHGVCVKCVVCG
jgi:hypothetical protein